MKASLVPATLVQTFLIFGLCLNDLYHMRVNHWFETIDDSTPGNRGNIIFISNRALLNAVERSVHLRVASLSCSPCRGGLIPIMTGVLYIIPYLFSVLDANTP